MGRRWSLCKGTAVSGGAWRPQIDALAQHFRCLWFDNRGYGKSLPLTPSLTVPQMGEDVLALMDAEEFATAHLIGHSLGGLIALSAASQARSRVLSLSLLNTFASGTVPTRIDRKLLWITLRTQVGTLPMRRRAFVELVMPKPYLQQHNLDKIVEHLSALFGRELGSPPKVAMKQVFAMRKFDATPLLPGLQGLPTLVMSSRHDLLAPPSAGRLLAQALARSLCRANRRLPRRPDSMSRAGQSTATRTSGKSVRGAWLITGLAWRRSRPDSRSRAASRSVPLAEARTAQSHGPSRSSKYKRNPQVLL
jgi:pimeloyl-ACP methyl ester carboxylesterase